MSVFMWWGYVYICGVGGVGGVGGVVEEVVYCICKNGRYTHQG